jgi:Flp pilus assembly protein TadG
MEGNVRCGNLCRVRDESGQVLVFAVVVMAVLIAMTGFALDVGHAYLAQRQLQSATDAAALAGALDLPVSAQAIQTAKNYGPEPGMHNAPATNDNATIDVQTKCVTAIVTGCTPTNGQVNSISVHSSAVVKTVFAKVIGFGSFTVHATATACSPCSVKPLDIMIVLDRTGSMCQFSDGTNDPACTDLNNARQGIETFLRAMNPQFHHVGFAVLPPSTGATRNAQCSPPSTPADANYDSPTAGYLMVPLSSDFASPPGTLNAGSTLVDRVECQQKAGGRTGYANALDAAQAELQKDGRPGVQKVIIFLSDGAANYGPLSSPASYRNQPCQAGINSANAAKSQGTTIYSIGYDLDGSNGVYQACLTRSNATETPNINALQAMQRIASSTDTFYNKPTPGQLNTIFASIAANIFRNAQLIDDTLS